VGAGGSGGTEGGRRAAGGGKGGSARGEETLRRGKKEDPQRVASGSPTLPLPPPKGPKAASPSPALRGFDYFLIRSFGPGLVRGAYEHNAPELLTHAERRLPPSSPLPPSVYTAPSSSATSAPSPMKPPSRSSTSLKDRSFKRGTAGQRLRGILWLVPRSIGVRLRRELRVA